MINKIKALEQADQTTIVIKNGLTEIYTSDAKEQERFDAMSKDNPKAIELVDVYELETIKPTTCKHYIARGLFVNLRTSPAASED